MATESLEKEILEQVEKLPPEQQRQILDHARALVQSVPSGVPGKALLPFAGTIEIEDLKTMTEAIEQGCEQVNTNEW